MRMTLIKALVACLLVVAAVALTVNNVRRTIAESTRPRTIPTERLDRSITEAPTDGILGDTSSAIKVVMFSDYQCPACRAATSRILDPGIRELDVAIVIKHFPLSSHPHSSVAGQAAACALKQRRFASMHRVIFGAADSLGLVPWVSLAKRAGIEDTAAFSRCMADDGSRELVARDRALGDSLGIKATPTFVIGTDVYTGLPWDLDLLMRKYADSLHSLAQGGPVATH